MTSKRAIVLAGGKGTRLRPYTVVLPKPLMPIGEYPILEVIVRQLVFHGFKHITLSVNHQYEIIKAYFGDGSKWGVLIDYYLESQPLGTMGPLKLIQDLPENFLVMNGDVLTDISFSNFFDFHVNSEAIFTISSFSREQNVDYGVLETNNTEELIGFTEKPKLFYEVSMGVYMANIKVLDFIPNNLPFGFDQLMLLLLSLNKRVITKKFSGYWLDIGRPDDYIQAIEQFEIMKSKFLYG
jgi:NDP-sugar pyrophosphorylase family protein